MKKLVSEDVLNELIIESRRITTVVREEFLTSTEASLHQKANPDSWSAIECLEHLNIAGRHYIAEIRYKLDHATARQQMPVAMYKPAMIGNYMAKSMLPKEGEITNKMKTFGGFHPKIGAGTKAIINEFLEQQEAMIALLEEARTYNLERIKIKSVLGNILRFRLGDAFRFVIAHNTRHILQAQKAL